MMKNNLEAAAVNAAQQILLAAHEPVAVSIQMLLQYITDNTGKDMAQASVSYIEEVLRLVCEASEPETAIL